MAVNNFDFVAPFYDSLAKLVFGNALLKAQCIHLSHIGAQDKVLVLGGGTGKILKQLSGYQEIDFVEKSKGMITRARKNSGAHNIHYIHQDFLLFEAARAYDVIICPFFLDCFNTVNLKIAVHKCKSLLKKNGALIVIDFDESTVGSLLLKSMHLFFRVSAMMESRELKNIHESILDYQFALVDEKKVHRNRVFSRLYRNL